MKILALIALLFLAACGNATPPHGALTPMPALDQLDETDVSRAVEEYLAANGAPANSQYDYAFVDLDHNNRRDVLVMMKLPHTYWCGWAGCPMLAFRANTNRFTFISRTENVRGPLYVSQKNSNGMRHIIARASGTNTADRSVSITFDGRHYTANAQNAPAFDGVPNASKMDKVF